jgi:hypothetical protein
MSQRQEKAFTCSWTDPLTRNQVVKELAPPRLQGQTRCASTHEYTAAREPRPGGHRV